MYCILGIPSPRDRNNGKCYHFTLRGKRYGACTFPPRCDGANPTSMGQLQGSPKMDTSTPRPSRHATGRGKRKSQKHTGARTTSATGKSVHMQFKWQKASRLWKTHETMGPASYLYTGPTVERSRVRFTSCVVTHTWASPVPKLLAYYAD